jgi:hypothetical protein
MEQGTNLAETVRREVNTIMDICSGIVGHAALGGSFLDVVTLGDVRFEIVLLVVSAPVPAVLGVCTRGIPLDVLRQGL